MKKLSDKYFNPDEKASEWYMKFKDEIEASKLKVIAARKEWNDKLTKGQKVYCKQVYDYRKHMYVDYFAKPTRLNEKPLPTIDCFYTFVSECGYQVIPIDSYDNLSKKVKNKLDANYLLY